MFENTGMYLMAIFFVIFIFLLAVSFIDSAFLKGRINKALERWMDKRNKKGSASSIAVLILLGAILIVMLLGFGFIKFNFSG